MSQEAAKALLAKMKTDDAFRTKIMGVSDVEARIRLINAEGFACSAADIQALSNEQRDDMLKGVSGGYGKGDTGSYASCDDVC